MHTDRWWCLSGQRKSKLQLDRLSGQLVEWKRQMQIGRTSHLAIGKSNRIYSIKQVFLDLRGSSAHQSNTCHIWVAGCLAPYWKNDVAMPWHVLGQWCGSFDSFFSVLQQLQLRIDGVNSINHHANISTHCNCVHCIQPSRCLYLCGIHLSCRCIFSVQCTLFTHTDAAPGHVCWLLLIVHWWFIFCCHRVIIIILVHG